MSLLNWICGATVGGGGLGSCRQIEEQVVALLEEANICVQQGCSMFRRLSSFRLTEL